MRRSRVKATHRRRRGSARVGAVGRLIGFLLERALAARASPLDNPLPESASVIARRQPRCRVRRATTCTARSRRSRRLAAPTCREPLAEPQVEPAASLVNGAPLDALTFSDPLTVSMDASAATSCAPCAVTVRRRSKATPSEPACVVPIDDFPPEPPAGSPRSIGDGAIDADLGAERRAGFAGYLVLRGEAGDATLTPVTDTVVTETRYHGPHRQAGRSVRLCGAGDRHAAAATERESSNQRAWKRRRASGDA